MNNNKSRANIHKMESNLREILGESFYNEIKEFYKKFIRINIDKVLITRRSYVLYKNFLYDFLGFHGSRGCRDKRDSKKKVRNVSIQAIPFLLFWPKKMINRS